MEKTPTIVISTQFVHATGAKLVFSTPFRAQSSEVSAPQEPSKRLMTKPLPPSASLFILG
jgi:hypothetical protein